MTVKELIEQLQNCPEQDAPVYYSMNCEKVNAAIWFKSDNCIILQP